jgi:putative NADH-flavin reductase
MQVIIFGASGKIGSRLVAEMLKRGHTVTAFVYGRSDFTTDERLRVVEGDVRSLDDVAKALHDQDAVLSCLGSWGTPTKDILTSGMQTIIPSMQRQGVRRIISLTGADARDTEDEPGLMQKFSHQLISLFAPKIVEDGEAHLRLLRASNLDWTVLRSPVMTNSGRFGGYKLRMKLPNLWATINRQDVVAAMADLVESDSFVAKAPVIYRA